MNKKLTRAICSFALVESEAFLFFLKIKHSLERKAVHFHVTMIWSKPKADQVMLWKIPYLNIYLLFNISLMTLLNPSEWLYTSLLWHCNSSVSLREWNSLNGKSKDEPKGSLWPSLLSVDFPLENNSFQNHCDTVSNSCEIVCFKR